MGLFRRIKKFFTPLTEQEVRDRRREKLLNYIDQHLKYQGVECAWEEFTEAGGRGRTKRVTKIILVD